MNTNSSLTYRIGTLLTLALVPFGILAVLQTWSAIDTVRDTYRETLAAQTMRAAQPESEAILRAFGLARGLANAVPSLLRDDPGRCVATMQRTVEQHPDIAFAGFIASDRTTRCNNMDRVFDFSDSPDSNRVFAAGTSDVTFEPSGRASGEAVVILSEPVFSELGDLDGFVSLSFPSSPLLGGRADEAPSPDLTLVTFNGDGVLLTVEGVRDSVAGLLPAEGGLATLAGTERRVFSAISADGERRNYALAPIVAGQAYALGIWDIPRLRASDLPVILSAAAFPLAMWLVSLTVAIIALRHQVIRPIRALRMRMRSFADGRAVFRASSITRAPRELQEIGATFERIADQVVRDEAELEDKLREREILLREVHHRVKNNLQLISSIINMQIRQNIGNEAKAALRRVQERLSSLAMFHRDLYETSSLSDLRADQLLEGLAQQTVSLSADPQNQVDLRLDFDPVTLPPDQAGPLAMLVTEALTNALKHAQAEGDAPLVVALSMKRSGGPGSDEITVRLENPLAGDCAPTDGNGMGTRLIRAFASQLEGRLTQERDGDHYVVTVEFTQAH